MTVGDGSREGPTSRQPLTSCWGVHWPTVRPVAQHYAYIRDYMRVMACCILGCTQAHQLLYFRHLLGCGHPSHIVRLHKQHHLPRKPAALHSALHAPQCRLATCSACKQAVEGKTKVRDGEGPTAQELLEELAASSSNKCWFQKKCRHAPSDLHHGQCRHLYHLSLGHPGCLGRRVSYM